MPRRDFLLALGAAIAFPAGTLPLSAQPPGALAVGLLEDPQPSLELRRGFGMAASEVTRAAELFRTAFRPSRGASVSRLLSAGAQVIVGGIRDGTAAAAAITATSRQGVLYVNAGSGANSLRSPSCAPLTVHVVPSAAMTVHGRAWDARLTRFGAEQLNDRYRHRYGEGMTGEAWCGWMALKVAWEAFLRARSTEGAAMLQSLDRARARFDGHKGRALTFDPGDWQLYQPLYSGDEAREATLPRPPIAEHGKGRCGS